MKKKIKLLLILGTRPEIIKLSPVIKACENHEALKTVVVSTAQHREMLDPFFELFGVYPEYNLNIMKENQSLSYIAVKCLDGLNKILDDEDPDMVIVQGDTTSAFSGALSAFYRNIKVGHIEAGLRSFDNNNPFPEEVNRQLISTITDLHFAPTDESAANLRATINGDKRIFVVGNTVIDALNSILKQNRNSLERHLNLGVFEEKRVILVTVHRRESWGKPLKNICHAFQFLVEKFTDIAVVFPVHLNPVVRQTVQSSLKGNKNIYLLNPLPYDSFVEAMCRCSFIITDSGGIQEEAPSLGKPVLVARKTTERPEAVQDGCTRIVGTQSEDIVREASQLLNNPEAYKAMARKRHLYGDGRAGERIRQAILFHFGMAERPVEFVPEL